MHSQNFCFQHLAKEKEFLIANLGLPKAFFSPSATDGELLLSVALSNRTLETGIKGELNGD